MCILAYAADAAVVNLSGIKNVLASSLITSFLNGNPLFVNVPRILPRNPPDWIILDNWVFDSLISADELLGKSWRRFTTCLLLN